MRPLERIIRDLCKRRLGREPDLENPVGYNDKIQWLKLHDQSEAHVRCCDKLGVRDYACETLGTSEHLLTVHEAADRFERLTYRAPCMVKTNHDSGSVRAISNRSDWRKAGSVIAGALGRSYGVEKGEWAYARIKPMAFTEERLPDPVTEYKFHCCEGEARFAQIITGRASGKPIEAITDPSGKLIPLRLFPDRRMLTGDPPLPNTWNDMIGIAEALAAPFRYVRVDLYSVGGRVFLSEMTFWPMTGCFLSPDERIFGRMLDFDMSVKREPLAA
jgi:hypothetical protein